MSRAVRGVVRRIAAVSKREGETAKADTELSRAETCRSVRMTGMNQMRNAVGRKKGYGGCLRCGGTWDYAKWHDTPYSETGSCFPLCESCWSELSPETRLPYYALLLGMWLTDLKFDGWEKFAVESADKWQEVREAVLAGK